MGINTKLATTRTQTSWQAMISRCTTKTARWSRYYWDKGICVCSRWLVFANFVADMGLRPVNTSIDRIDPNGNYEPTNCRWATRQEQGRNRANNRILTSCGVSRCVTEWSEILGVMSATLTRRKDYGWSDERTLTEPVRAHRRKKRSGEKSL